MFLTQVQNAQPDYVALGMVIVLAIVVAIMAIRKKLSVRPASEIHPVAVTAEEKPVAPGSAGGVKLYNVEPKTAAMLMAIVAEKTGKPLNELRFISIQEVK